MKKILLLLGLFVGFICSAQDPIFEPSMLITGLGTVNSPIGEEVDKIIDGDVNTKFLDFELADGMGFTVNLGGTAATASSIELITANDFPERDPIEFEVLGSNDATNYTSLLIDVLPCITERLEPRTFAISNTESYLFYRINFPTPCDPTGGMGIPSIQLAEVQLYEIILGVGENGLLSDQFELAPNPSNGQFTIVYTGSKQLENATITDILGNVVQAIDLQNFSKQKTITMDTAAVGMYFLNISSANQSVVKRIIIK